MGSYRDLHFCRVPLVCPGTLELKVCANEIIMITRGPDKQSAWLCFICVALSVEH